MCKCKLKSCLAQIYFCIYWVTFENVKKELCKNISTWRIVTEQCDFSFAHFLFRHCTFRGGGKTHIFSPQIGNALVSKRVFIPSCFSIYHDFAHFTFVVTQMKWNVKMQINSQFLHNALKIGIDIHFELFLYFSLHICNFGHCVFH